MINVSKLSAALKKQNTIIWIKKDGINYLITDHFMIKTRYEITGSVLTHLVKVLKNIPKEGQGFKYRYEAVSELDGTEISSFLSFMDGIDTAKEIKYTDLLQVFKGEMYSIFKSEKEYIYVNKLYSDIVTLTSETKILGSTRRSPIYFITDNETVIILPFKLEKSQYLL